MPIHRVETYTKSDYNDVHGQEVAADIKQLGINNVETVQSIRVFLIEGELEREGLERIGQELLVDPVSEQFQLGRSEAPPGLAQATLIEVHLKICLLNYIMFTLTWAIIVSKREIVS